MNCPSESLQEEERREELLGWFRHHQKRYPNNELPSAAELQEMAETMRELYEICTSNDTTFQELQARLGQLSAASKLLQALCKFAGDQEGYEAYESHFAGHTTSATTLRRYENMLQFPSPISQMEASTPFMQWYATRIT